VEKLLNVIIPVYNEKENISKALDDIREKVKTPHNVTIVYDFPEDNTVPAVKNYININNAKNICLLHNDFGRGVLNAIKKGFSVSGSEMTLVTMGDLSDDMSTVDTMVSKMQAGYDLVCGSRYMQGGRQIGGPRIKKTLSRLAGLSLNLLTGIPSRDISNNFKLYRTSMLKNIKIESTGGFELGLEILVKAWLKGHKITEVPSVWKDRSAGQSRFKLLKWLPKYLRWYIYAVMKPFKQANK
jgi:glycosyltransferase involved in cell wall biosynthesis